MYTRGGLGALPRASLIGMDPQSFAIYSDAVEAGLVADSAEGEAAFSIRWTSRVEDLLRAGEWRFAAWQEFEHRNLPTGTGSRMTLATVTPAWAVGLGRDFTAAWAYKFGLSNSDQERLAEAFAWAVGLPWPWGSAAVTSTELLPTEILAPSSGSTLQIPITERTALPVPVVSPDGTIAPQGFVPVPGGWVAVAPPVQAPRQHDWTDEGIPAPVPNGNGVIDTGGRTILTERNLAPAEAGGSPEGDGSLPVTAAPARAGMGLLVGLGLLGAVLVASAKQRRR